MCGILGIVTHSGGRPSVDAPAAERMRDTMTSRGPDDAGLDDLGCAILAHRRLAVIDPTPAGHQPMRTPDGRFVLVYNGELYNDRELRARLEAEGVRFTTRCDTETVLWAVAKWGADAARSLRGMYAFGLFDTREHTLTLGRDPLGIKPLYTHARARGGGAMELVFASEPRAILATPEISAEPDLVTLSSYLTTIRPTLGCRTMFAGVETLRPGEWRVYDLNDPGLAMRRHDYGTELGLSGSQPEQLDQLVLESVARHMRSDVPVCCLLSGGLDSTIIAHAARKKNGLNTYCAGAEGGSPSPDLEVARRVAGWLGSEHTEAVVSRGMFAQRWQEMVRRTGLPLSTPNEVAINHIAAALRSKGHVVALSGEGADELFGGYAQPMMLAAEHVARLGGQPDLAGGRFQLESNQWVPISGKAAVLEAGVLAAIDGDAAVYEQFDADFAELAAAGGDGDPLQVHLRFQRRVNLENLLARLDRATMLESVEGRTPLADVAVGAHAEGLAMGEKFAGSEPARTKIALRRAFAGVLPEEVVDRPKASFPLPFEAWVGDCAPRLGESAFARAVFSEAAIATVAEQPGELWSLAWPMVNVGMWGDVWWG